MAHLAEPAGRATCSALAICDLCAERSDFEPGSQPVHCSHSQTSRDQFLQTGLPITADRTMVAVGTRITPRPPHRSRRALLTHRAYMRTRLSRGYSGGV